MNEHITHAKAMIIWGESPEEVQRYLESQGVNEKQAEGVVISLMRERRVYLKSEGGKKIILWSTALTICLGVIALMISNEITPRHYRSRYDPVTIIYGLLGLVVLLSMWRLAGGLVQYLIPGHIKGDIHNLD